MPNLFINVWLKYIYVRKTFFSCENEGIKTCIPGFSVFLKNDKTVALNLKEKLNIRNAKYTLRMLINLRLF